MHLQVTSPPVQSWQRLEQDLQRLRPPETALLGTWATRRAALQRWGSTSCIRLTDTHACMHHGFIWKPSFEKLLPMCILHLRCAIITACAYEVVFQHPLRPLLLHRTGFRLATQLYTPLSKAKFWSLPMTHTHTCSWKAQ